MNAITDRTILDVQRVKTLREKIISNGFINLTELEKTEWLNGLKGSFRYSDMNRIESNLKEISDMLLLGFTTKTDWQIGDFPTIADFLRIQTYVLAIKNSPYAYKTTVLAPEMPINTYQKINDIEKILLESYDFAISQDVNIEYSGELYDEIGSDSEVYYCDNEIICDDDFII